MNIDTDKDGKRTVRLKNAEIAALRRTERIVSDLERLEISFLDPDSATVGAGLRDLLKMPFCQPRTLKKREAPDEPERDFNEFEVQPAVEQEEKADAKP